MEQDNRTNYEYTDKQLTNGTYYRRPGQIPDASDNPGRRTPTTPANAFAKASMVIGAVALASVFTFTIFPAVILGALALILALLSRGAELSFHPTARNGIMLSILALVANIALVVGTCFMILGDSPYHEELNATYEEMFGMSYDEILQGIMDGSIETDDLYEQLFEQMQEDMQ